MEWNACNSKARSKRYGGIDGRPTFAYSRLDRLFNGVNGYRQSPAQTIDGLSPGAIKSAALDALGKPNKTKAGTPVRDWFWYQQGCMRT